MAVSEIHTFPQFSQVSLVSRFGSTKLEYVFTFRERTKSWYIDIYRLTGEALVLGRRISPGWSFVLGYNETIQLLDGVFLVLGPSEYAQVDLGKTVRVWHVPNSDLLTFQTVAPPELEPTITITS